jgi:alpha-L-fucosidase 2
MQPSRRTALNAGLSATALSLLPPAFASQSGSSNTLSQTLWYRQPATRWLEALPVGNGRLSGMVFGGVADDRLALNESTLWSGQPSGAHENPEGLAHLSQIRQLLFDGQYLAARDLCSRYLVGRKLDFGTHLPLGNLLLEWGHEAAEVTQYRRALDLDEAVARVEYGAGGAQFVREVLASNPAGVIAIRAVSSLPGRIHLTLRLDPGNLPAESATEGNDMLTLAGHAFERVHSNGQCGVGFEARVVALAKGGRVTTSPAATSVPKTGTSPVKGASLRIQAADELLLLIAVNTTFHGHDPAQENRRQLSAAASRNWSGLRKEHVADHQALYRRVTFDLGGAGLAQTTPTDERLAAVRRGGSTDHHLASLFFQYGRYLTIAGSRQDSPLPLNLQGIWNDGRASSMPWTCDFHLDINTQQNYWAAEVCNLAECHAPLFRFLERLAQAGRGTARTLYGVRGWVAHVVTNPWGYTAPGWGLGWGIFPTGGVWMAMDLWDHYQFTQDRGFLEHRAYPVLEQAALFFLDYLVAHPKHGWLVTGPATSPENAFLTPEGQACSESMGPTCDSEQVRALFQAVREAARILKRDPALQQELGTALGRLPPLRTGSYGQLMEWLEDFPEASPNHRHTSHLVALYPFHQITPRATPELAQAARVTIQRRTQSDHWEDVEWVRANFVAFYARLYDGESAYRHVLGQLAEDTGINLMTYSRGGVAGAEENIFSLDGNTGTAGAIAEMLVQSHQDEIHLLPALPAAWPTGSVSGLCCRGNVEVSLAWKNGTLETVSLHPRLIPAEGGKASRPAGRELRLRYRERTATLALRPGAKTLLNQRLERM